MDTNKYFLLIVTLFLANNGFSVNGQNVTEPQSTAIQTPPENNSTISVTIKLSSPPSTDLPPTTPSILQQVIDAANLSVPLETVKLEPKTTVLGDQRPPKILPCEMNTVTSTSNSSNSLALVQCYNHNGTLVTIGVTTFNLPQTSATNEIKTNSLDMKSLAIIVVGYVAFLCVIAIVGVAGVLVVACQQGVNRRSRCQAGYQTIV